MLRIYIYIAFIPYLSLAAVKLKVGLYNSIPDLQDDKLLSYKLMVEKGFQKDGLSVDAVVDEASYDPYSDLTTYLQPGNFDLIEIDTATLTPDIKKLLVDVNKVYPIPPDTLPAARSAVQDKMEMFGYPTLVCGNFIIGFSPGTECSCPFKKERYYKQASPALSECVKPLVVETYKRLLGGKMSDNYGWYLPYIYLDSYIDIYGPESVAQGIEETLEGKVDMESTSKLFGLCQNPETDDQLASDNKCLFDFPGSYVNNKKNVIKDIKNKETMFFFGFSEIAADISQETGFCPYAAMSYPAGPSTYLLQYTDALVVSKAAWYDANEEKQNAIREFVKYFTGNDLRRKIALGEDLTPPRTRYLLQATETFYETVDDSLYKDLYWQLKRAVPAPILSDSQKQGMQAVLNTYISEKSKNKKTEL